MGRDYLVCCRHFYRLRHGLPYFAPWRINQGNISIRRPGLCCGQCFLNTLYSPYRPIIKTRGPRRHTPTLHVPTPRLGLRPSSHALFIGPNSLGELMEEWVFIYTMLQLAVGICLFNIERAKWNKQMMLQSWNVIYNLSLFTLNKS